MPPDIRRTEQAYTKEHWFRHSQHQHMMVCNMGASLYEPINVYKLAAPNIGIVDGPFEYLTVIGAKLPASVHNPNDSGAPFKRRPLPPFADQVRRETG
jgi:hypothetical protein